MYASYDGSQLGFTIRDVNTPNQYIWHDTGVSASGIAVDSNNNVYMPTANHIRKYDLDGKLLVDMTFPDAGSIYTDPDGLDVRGNWELQEEDRNGFLSIADGETGDEVLLEADDTWTDYIVNADIRICSGVLYIDVRREETDCIGYRFVINTETPMIQAGILEQTEDSCDIGEIMAENTDFAV